MYFFQKTPAHSVVFKKVSIEALVCQVIDFKFKLLSNSFKLVFLLEPLNIYFQLPSFLIMSQRRNTHQNSSEKNSPSRFWYYLLKTCLKNILNFIVKHFNYHYILVTLVSTETFVTEALTFENVEICKIPQVSWPFQPPIGTINN